MNFPIDGYVATAGWAQRFPNTAAAFVRAIEAGQVIANTDPVAVQAAIGKYDHLPVRVTATIVLSGYPIGAVQEPNIQRVAVAMLNVGMLGRQYAADVERGTLAEAMAGPAPDRCPAADPRPVRKIINMPNGAWCVPSAQVRWGVRPGRRRGSGAPRAPGGDPCRPDTGPAWRRSS